jgi:hypothetical protein
MENVAAAPGVKTNITGHCMSSNPRHPPRSCYTQRMNTKSGGRRDSHPLAPDAATRKAKKAERLAKGKFQNKLQGAQRRDAKDQMRRPSDD